MTRASPAMTPASAIAPGGILAPYFGGPSWKRWIAVLRAAYGEPLSPDEHRLFREVAERDPPVEPVKELWAIAGRRAGKDSIASAIATVASLQDYSAQLRPGERATIACIASTRDQSQIVFRYIKGYFEAIPALAALVQRATDDTISLTNSTEIVVSTNSFRAVRGRSIVVAIMDEIAFYRSDESANPDSELYNAVLPAMATFPSALLIGISSPYRRSGLLYQKWQASYGKPDADVLVVRGSSRLFNETLSQKLVDERLARDPEAGAAEYLAEWRNDLSDFLDRELVESAVDAGVRVRPPRHDLDYRMFVDASGGRGDSFTAAIAHTDGDTAVVDAVFERRAPFSPPEVVKEVADLARSYGIGRVAGDRFAADWVVSAFAAEGLIYEASTRNRSTIYLDALPLFTSGRIRLPDDRRLVHQFVSLERRVSRFGKADGVNHPDGGADDLANAAAGAAVLASLDKRPALVNGQDLLREGAPWPVPARCESVSLILATNKRGEVGALYLGTSAAPILIGTKLINPVYVLDFSAGPMRRGIFEEVRDAALAWGERLHVITAPWGALAVFCWSDPRLVRQADLAGLSSDPIPEHLIVGENDLMLSAAMHVQQGLVRICEPAAERARTSPFGGAMDFRGDDAGDDPLRRAALWGLALMHDAG